MKKTNNPGNVLDGFSNLLETHIRKKEKILFAEIEKQPSDEELK